MTIREKTFLAMIVFVCLTVFAGCTNYERQVVPFKLPENTHNAVSFNGAVIAARSFSNTNEAMKAFGFDIRSAGILPVQVVFDNKGSHPLIIIPDQTFLIDEESNVWPILDQNLAYDLLSKATELGKVVPEAAADFCWEQPEQLLARQLVSLLGQMLVKQWGRVRQLAPPPDWFPAEVKDSMNIMKMCNLRLRKICNHACCNTGR